MRLFIAVDLPVSLKERLGEIVAELSACGADVRWVHADSMHLTLKFLGNVEPGELVAIDGVLSRVAGTAQSTHCRLRNLGSFPHLRRPRVLWIGVETIDAALLSLHAELDASLAEIGFAKEKRGFHPHITLGRVRHSSGLPALREVVEARDQLVAGEFVIDRLTLFESELRQTGARHTQFGVYPFGQSLSLP